MNKYRILVKGIVKYEDKYLVVKKWYDDRISEPYQWEFIDGHIEFKESPDKAVLRHIYDQTGLSVVIDKILYTWTFMTGDVYNIGISYLCLTTIDSITLSEELTDYRFIHREEFEHYLSKKVLEDFEKFEG
ncbi:NUDIX domain-containing protein [Mobilitalea sibirica]|uniref:NUDIX domain-containing protein n=1 Tax=Mobilitalea sibirica TaxID=1462919 RepID=A0A8J7L299_9FIRM|nr:NUDIX domain-containing protein [Mobilitalea sibirica]MBH1940163.1 NUDIX domain-containing protein [Mobilitalea sibirica]